jgi:molybdopterin/thiamine biosynthesis adenylyltransferase
MSVASYADQTDIFNPAKFAWPVHLIGVGGIGSALALPLLKLGLRAELHLWDDDPYVEGHNIPAQLIYRPQDIGVPKLAAALDILAPYKDPRCTIVPHNERATSETEFSGIVIGAVDSMASRQAIWNAVKYNPEVVLLLDGRIGGEQYQLFTINPCDPDDVEFYESWLFDDAEGSELPCAARTVIHPPLVLAGRIIAQITLFVRELPMKRYIDEHLRTTQLSAF